MDVKKFAAIVAATAMVGTVSLATAPPDMIDSLLSVSAATYLKLESSGDSVKQLQQKLITLNYMNSGSDTGTFDETTDGAVRNLQTEYNLKVDGIVGPSTLGLVDGLVNGTAKVIKVNAAKVNVRSSANTNCTIVTTTDKDQKLVYDSYETVGDVKWYKVTVGESQGYICGTYVSVVELTPVNSTTTTTSANKTSSKSGTLRVTGTILNVRSSTSTSSKKITSLKKGQTFTYSNVKKVNGVNWYYIKLDSSRSGWVMGTFVSIVDPSQTSGKLKVTGNVLNVRSDASTSSNKITTLKQGQTFTYSGVKNVDGINWYFIDVNSSTKGWVMGTFISLVQTGTTSPAESGTLKVTGNVLNVRSSTSTSSKKLTTLKLGQIFTYSNAKTVSGVKWYYIRVNSSISGWVMGTYVYPTPNTTTSTTTTATQAPTSTTTASAAESGTLKVKGTVVNVRSGAGIDNEKITEVKQGESYTYTDKKDGWYYIQISSSQSGWIIGDYVEATPNTTASTSATEAGSSNNGTTTTASGAQSGTLKVKGTVVNVRSGAGTENTKITEVKQGESYTYTDFKNGWYYIQVSSTQSGWIIGDYVEATPNTTTTSSSTSTSQSASSATSTSPETGRLKITGTVVNVRSGIGTDNAKITEVKQGETYTYTDKKNGWYYIQVSSTKKGWIMGDYVEATPDPTTTTSATSATSSSQTSSSQTNVNGESGTLEITGTVVNVRSGPGTNYSKITEVVKGKTYTYTEEKDGWYHIWISSEQSGWVIKDYVSATPITSPPSTTSSTNSSSATSTSNSSASSSSSTSSSGQRGTLHITGTVVNVRSGPGTTYSKISEVRHGEVFNYIDYQNGWFCISLSNSKTGWVMGDYVEYLAYTTQSTSAAATTSSEPQSGNGSTTAQNNTTTSTTKLTTTTTEYKESGTLVVTTDVLNVRADNYIDAKKITEVREGEVYRYTDCSFGWYYIQVSSTKSGWVLGSYVKATPDPTTTTSTTTTTTTTTTTAPTTTTSTSATTETSSTESTTKEPTTTTTAATVGRKVIVGTVKVTGTLNVRKGAGQKYAKLGTLKNGTTVIIASKGKNWHKIEYGTGYGYVSAQYIKDVKTTYENMILKYTTDYNYVDKGKTIDLGLSVGGASVSYTSSDSVRCPVSNKGIVNGKTEGLYTITAKSGLAVASTCVVVMKSPYSDVKAMKISAEGTKFIVDWEGGGTVLPTGETVFYPYQDVSGYWTIGYGHAKTTTASKSWSEERAIAEFNKDIEAMIGKDYILTDEKPYLSAECATALLNADLNDGAYVNAVSDWAVRNGVKLTQTQFDALVSFCYNLGPSLWQNDSNKFYLKSAIISHRCGSDAKADQVIEGFCRYMKSSGKNYKGLWYRRRNEAELFLEGDYALDRENKFKLPSGITWA